MYKPQSVQENEIHKVLWNFGIQRDDPIPPPQKKNRHSVYQQEKNNLTSCGIYGFSGPLIESERKRKDWLILDSF